MIKITYLDLASIFWARNTALRLYIRARVLVKHPNHHHVVFLYLNHLLLSKVSAVAISGLSSYTTSGTLLTRLCECDDATPRSHMDLVISLVFFFIICILNDFRNIRQFLSSQFVVSDGS
jgi:hypothetical protein